MTDEGTNSRNLLISLRERAKELNCLYRVDEILMGDDPLEDRLLEVAEAVPHGWFSPELCEASIIYMGREHSSDGYGPGGPELSENLVVNGSVVGEIILTYPGEVPELDRSGAFLAEEKKLLANIAQKISQAILHASLSSMFGEDGVDQEVRRSGSESWRTILDMLFITDRKLHRTLLRRLLNYLSFIGIKDATALLNRWVGESPLQQDAMDHQGINQPIPRQQFEMDLTSVQKILSIADREMSNEQILVLLQRWIGENRIEHLINVLDDHASSLSEIMQAMETNHSVVSDESTLSEPVLNALKVSLIRRLVSRRLDYISRLKESVSIADFYELGSSMIFPVKSHGQLGGKGAGLFMAGKVLQHAGGDDQQLSDIRIPNTWYIASDGILDFVHYNHLEELLEYRYRYLGEIRLEYPNLIQLFKNCAFSPEMKQGLSMTLDTIGERPLIIRSSSLLEDSSEAAFSGKYKSLFLANQGSKAERLESLLDAIAEVYASMFGPDPIEYRSERNLLDFQEEMGILIQEVVGNKVGRYFMPAFSGVAFCRNEFRWSSRIRREDGLVRLVPGLGTRAVDRLGDDYPVMAAPGQPGLRVNTSIDETIQYSPRFMDVINMERMRIETIKVEDIIREYGAEYPQFDKVFSSCRDGMIRKVNRVTDFAEEFVIPTFEGLMSVESGFLSMMKRLMTLLEHKSGFPVDIEFAADGDNLYLLQCRAQISRAGTESVYISERPDTADVIFTAERYVSDGFLPGITYVVFVDPEGYDGLEEKSELIEVGRTVGRLNGILPRGSFILMGPGRWGSRGDIKLGVSVTYSDINNTAALIEMAFRKGSYVPDLSFGTHFFQDLVEAGIFYLPLYPSEKGITFNTAFFSENPNILSQLLPDCAHLAGIVRVIDVPAVTGGRILRLAMRGEEGRAEAYLVDKGKDLPKQEHPQARHELTKDMKPDDHWLWRQRMAEAIATSIDPETMGVKGIYLFGSTKNATAGPCSDIDLLLHIQEDETQKSLLNIYLEGWNACLAEMNYIRTGFRTDGLLDIHLVTDRDIESKQSFAIKIGSITDPARPLDMKKQDS